MSPEVAEKVSVDEYLELLQTSDIRYEYVDGTLIPMPGESRKANALALNLVEALRKPLRAKGFDTFAHDVRTNVLKGRIYRFPDVVVTPADDNAETHAVNQPVLLAEVLSEGTQDVDRGAKLREYCALPSLQYYLLIAQHEVSVECYRRNGEVWEYLFFLTKTDVLDLPFFGVSLSLTDLYEGIF
jgi:Uma2 family endonuclease